MFSRKLVTEVGRPRSLKTRSSPHPSMSLMAYGLGQYTWTHRGHRIVGHHGRWPSYQAVVLRLPDDDIGLAVFCHDETFGPTIIDVIVNTIIDDLLHLEPMDWERPLMAATYFKGVESHPSPPRNARPSPDISGKYFDEAYGDLSIVRLENHPLADVFKKVINEYPLNTFPVNPDKTFYIGETRQPILGRFIFSPWDGPIFSQASFKAESLTALDGSGKLHSGNMYTVGKVVWTDKGIGMFEGFWGSDNEVPGREAREEDVEERAEVWFKRIG